MLVYHVDNWHFKEFKSLFNSSSRHMFYIIEAEHYCYDCYCLTHFS